MLGIICDPWACIIGGPDSAIEPEVVNPKESGIWPAFETPLFTVECVPLNIEAILAMAEGVMIG